MTARTLTAALLAAGLGLALTGCTSGPVLEDVPTRTTGAADGVKPTITRPADPTAPVTKAKAALSRNAELAAAQQVAYDVAAELVDKGNRNPSFMDATAVPAPDDIAFAEKLMTPAAYNDLRKQWQDRLASGTAHDGISALFTWMAWKDADAAMVFSSQVRFQAAAITEPVVAVTEDGTRLKVTFRYDTTYLFGDQALPIAKRVETWLASVEGTWLVDGWQARAVAPPKPEPTGTPSPGTSPGASPGASPVASPGAKPAPKSKVNGPAQPPAPAPAPGPEAPPAGEVAVPLGPDGQPVNN